MSDLDDFVGRVRGLLISLSSELTEAESAEVQHLIDHDEHGEALRTLAWIMVEGDKTISFDAYRSIRRLSAGLVREGDMPAELAGHVQGIGRFDGETTDLLRLLADDLYLLCPVCGFADLDEVPWVGRSGSDEICPSCGTHIGYDDAAGEDLALRSQRHRELREKWKAGGFVWSSVGRTPPPGWNPDMQVSVFDVVD